ncbi:MAG: hypothetical protein ACP5OO_07770 [Chloroflexia bacterium]
MAKSLQEALLEVEEDLKRIGLQVRAGKKRRRGRRKGPAAPESSARPSQSPSGVQSSGS